MKVTMTTLGKIAEIRAGVGFPMHLQGRQVGRYPFAKVGDISCSARLGIPLASARNYVDDDLLLELGAKPFPRDSIVFAKIGEGISQNFRVLTACDVVLDNNAMGIICDARQVMPGFLLHYLRTVDFYPLAGKTSVPAIRKSAIEALPVSLPTIQEQRRIAAILDKADAIRRRRQEAIALTEQLLRSTFLEMFGDPVTNPKRWPWISMDEIVSETQYGTSEKANEERQGLPVLRMNNLTYLGGIDLASLKWCDIAPGDLSAYTVKRGDLLFNRTNSPELVGKTAIWTLDEPYAFAGYLVRVRFDATRALPHYVSGFLNSDYGKRTLFAMQKTSNNMSNISATDLRRVRIPLPAIDQQRRYDRFVEAIVRNAPRRQDALAQADKLFNSLVQRAFTGHL